MSVQIYWYKNILFILYYYIYTIFIFISKINYLKYNFILKQLFYLSILRILIVSLKIYENSY